MAEFRQSLGFQEAFHSANNKIWVFSRHNFSLSVASSAEQYLHLECRHPLLAQSFYITAIYAKSTVVGRRILWANLLDLQLEVQDLPWLVGGDFNTVLSADEAMGAVAPNSRAMAEFADFLRQTDFRKLPTIGGTYTWTGVRRRGRVWSYLA